MRFASSGAAVFFLLIGCGDDSTAPAGPVATFRLASAPMTVLDIPYPNDLYRGSDGLVQVAGLPSRVDSDPNVVRGVVDALNQEPGFGATCGVFFAYQGGGPIDATSLTDDSAFLIHLPDGAQVPVQRHARDDDHQIIVAPRPGEVLIEGESYAAVLTTAIRDTAGRALRADVDLGRGLDSPPYRSLSGWLSQQGIARSKLAAASVFTVHPITRALELARADVLALPNPRATLAPASFQYFGAARLDEFFGPTHPHDQIGFAIQGSFQSPYYLADSQSRLGWFSFDPSGKPMVKAMINVPFSLALPKPGNGGPEANYHNIRAIVFQHGLGGSRANVFTIANDFCARGYAVIGIDIPYHGDRQIAAAGRDLKHNLTGADGPDGLVEDLPLASAAEYIDLLGDAPGTPNPVRRFYPPATRDPFRQATLELSGLARLIAQGDWSAVQALDPALAAFSFEPGKLLYSGVSFGAIHGGIVMAVEPRYQAAVLPVGGGGLVFPLLVNSTEFDPQFEPPFQGAFGIDNPHRDPTQHPAQFLLEYAVYQQLIEYGDPLAYAPYVIRSPLPSGSAKNVLLLEAFADETVPNHATEALARAMGLHLVTYSRSPAAGMRYIDALPTDAAPAVANVTAGPNMVTSAIMQFDPATHGMYDTASGTRHYMPDWPPLVRLPQPVPVANPVAELHRLALRYADTFYEMPVPQIIDPYQ